MKRKPASYNATREFQAGVRANRYAPDPPKRKRADVDYDPAAGNGTGMAMLDVEWAQIANGLRAAALLAGAVARSRGRVPDLRYAKQLLAYAKRIEEKVGL